MDFVWDSEWAASFHKEYIHTSIFSEVFLARFDLCLYFGSQPNRFVIGT